MMSGPQHIESAFNDSAGMYDETFENNPITQRIRPIIWQSLLKHFKPGDHILELNCGTGTDAIMLAEQGINVTAIDSSTRMIETARQKVIKKQLTNHIHLQVLNFENLEYLVRIDPFGNGRLYDGAFSNFGGFNCTPELKSVVERLSMLVKTHGVIIACLLNKICIWEMMSFLVRGKLGKAFRRLHNDCIQANLGGVSVQVWYYSPGQFANILSPWFTVEGIYGLNIFSPSPNSMSFASKHQALTTSLLNIDERFRYRFPFYALGDHFVVEARRSS
ncbi:MAG: methyltransferase domain-containing protein [Ignavibacteriae bacterium]|nr:methyltransferase domain-containing protein [Ignavibacteriota bacterium]